MRADCVLAGVYDPLRRLEPATVEARLTSGLQRFGAVIIHRAGAVTAATAVPEGAAPPAAPGGVLCLVDGYLEAAVAPAPHVVAACRDFNALRGAFSALVWDAGQERGRLVRDQLGQRPLFVLEAGPVLFFASEVRPLIALPDRRPAPDPVAVARYLSPSRLREEIVPYSGVRRVPGGHLVRLEAGRWRIERYWTPRYREPMSGSPAELAEATRVQITGSVERMAGGAAQVGVLLSGGLDSTTVASLAATAARERGAGLRAYSQTFPDHPTVDESEQIVAAADFAGIDLTRVDVFSGSSLAGSLEHLELYELPEFSATGFFWRPLARRAVADGIDVLLSGEGGDEVFAGPVYLIADAVRRGRIREALGLVERFPNIAYNPWRSLRLHLLWEYGILPSLPPRLHTAFEEHRDRGERRRYMSPYGLSLLGGPADARPWRSLDGPAWWAGKVDHFARKVWELGAPEQTTRAARLAGVTERHPLLSLDLVEFALRLPPERGFDAERTRPDLRRAMEGIVPDAVRLRPDKVDFDAVRGHSLLSDMPVIRQLLDDPQSRIRPYVRPEVVHEILQTTPVRWGALSRWGGELMRLVTAECWLRHQDDQHVARGILDGEYLTPSKLSFR